MSSSTACTIPGSVVIAKVVRRSVSACTAWIAAALSGFIPVGEPTRLARAQQRGESLIHRSSPDDACEHRTGRVEVVERRLQLEPDGTCGHLEVPGEHAEPRVPELVVGICERDRDRLVDAHVGGPAVDHVHEIPLGVVRRGREATELQDRSPRVGRHGDDVAPRRLPDAASSEAPSSLVGPSSVAPATGDRPRESPWLRHHPGTLRRRSTTRSGRGTSPREIWDRARPSCLRW